MVMTPSRMTGLSDHIHYKVDCELTEPSPASQTAFTVHAGDDSCREDRAEAVGQTVAGVHDCNAESKLIARVESGPQHVCPSIRIDADHSRREHKDSAGEEGRFRHTDQEPKTGHLRVVVREAAA